MIRFRGAWKALLGVLLAAGLASAPALAADDHLGFEPQYWDQSMDGTLRVDGETLRGTEVDLGDDLGLEEKDKVPAGRFWIRWRKRHSLAFTAFRGERSGEEMLASPLAFNGETFPAGETVSSRVETELKSLLYGYDFLNRRLVRAGFRIGAGRLGFEASLDSPSLPAGISGSESVTFPIAGLGIAFEPIPLLRFTGEVSGIGGSIGDNGVTFYDARIQAEVYWWRCFGMIAGYRRMKTDVDREGFGAADVTQKGPYAGFVIRF